MLNISLINYIPAISVYAPNRFGRRPRYNRISKSKLLDSACGLVGSEAASGSDGPGFDSHPIHMKIFSRGYGVYHIIIINISLTKRILDSRILGA